MKDSVIILGFDPGLSTTGWNVSEYSIKTKKLNVLQFGMLMPNKDSSTSEHKENVVKYGQRIMTLTMLRMYIDTMMTKFNPDLVVSEDAFYNPMRPSAYAALLQWLTTVDMLLHDNWNKVLFKLAPRLVKKIISGTGTADKCGVQDAILHNPDIVFKQADIENQLTEHISDSIGIVYTFTQKILPFLFDIWCNGIAQINGQIIQDQEELKRYFS